MKLKAVCIGLFAICGCASQDLREGQALQARGQTIVEANCSVCHAVARAGESPAPEAPPFRYLSEKHRVGDLEEALGEGISVGHPAMPEFQFATEDVDAVIAYLESIQEEPDR